MRVVIDDEKDDVLGSRCGVEGCKRLNFKECFVKNTFCVSAGEQL